MFWLCVLGAAWGGFLLGVMFISWWGDAHRPYEMADEMLEWSQATFDAQADAISSTEDSYVSPAQLHAIAAIRAAHIDSARGRYTS